MFWFMMSVYYLVCVFLVLLCVLVLVFQWHDLRLQRSDLYTLDTLMDHTGLQSRAEIEQAFGPMRPDGVFHVRPALKNAFRSRRWHILPQHPVGAVVALLCALFCVCGAMLWTMINGTPQWTLIAIVAACLIGDAALERTYLNRLPRDESDPQPSREEQTTESNSEALLTFREARGDLVDGLIDLNLELKALQNDQSRPPVIKILDQTACGRELRYLTRQLQDCDNSREECLTLLQEYREMLGEVRVQMVKADLQEDEARQVVLHKKEQEFLEAIHILADMLEVPRDS